MKYRDGDGYSSYVNARGDSAMNMARHLGDGHGAGVWNEFIEFVDEGDSVYNYDTFGDVVYLFGEG